jgi:hypothetical protein
VDQLYGGSVISVDPVHVYVYIGPDNYTAAVVGVVAVVVVVVHDRIYMYIYVYIWAWGHVGSCVFNNAGFTIP